MHLVRQGFPPHTALKGSTVLSFVGGVVQCLESIHGRCIIGDSTRVAHRDVWVSGSNHKSSLHRLTVPPIVLLIRRIRCLNRQRSKSPIQQSRKPILSWFGVTGKDVQSDGVVVAVVPSDCSMPLRYPNPSLLPLHHVTVSNTGLSWTHISSANHRSN